MLRLLLSANLVFTAIGAAGPAAGASCTDAADDQIWKVTGRTNFMGDLFTCFEQCCGNAPCATSCTKKRRGYSDACAQCYGDFSHCTIQYCQSKCIGGNATQCVACFEDHCKAPFDSCSGLKDAPWTPHPMHRPSARNDCTVAPGADAPVVI
mmetsp:Transcript_69785/g.204259  ORF Transcript_69785/g.204259 Transcript_69785/m.204259 type:complete len:152 (+) Transcript_69785:61-516(+)